MVITGGEPFLQTDLPELVTALNQQKKKITIETNGTIFQPLDVDLLSISPKLSNSTPNGKWKIIHEEKRLSIDSLKSMINHQIVGGKDFQIKFVVEDPEDINEINEIIQRLDLDGISEKIFLMPQARTREELRNGYEKLVNLCKSTGYRLGTRTHVEIWGDKRRV